MIRQTEKWLRTHGGPSPLPDAGASATPEEFHNTHNKLMVVGDTWKRTEWKKKLVITVPHQIINNDVYFW